MTPPSTSRSSTPRPARGEDVNGWRDPNYAGPWRDAVPGLLADAMAAAPPRRRAGGPIDPNALS
jgi:hypothetical protein